MTEEYIERMMDILEVYERPYNPLYPVVCFDEKSKQLLDKLRKSILANPEQSGSRKKVDYEYKRNGTINIFVAVEPKGKKRHLLVTKRRTKADFAKVIKQLVMEKYKQAEKVVLVTDNLNTHNEKTLREILGEEAEATINRIEWHYTPKHGSWLNMAEIEINVLSRQCLNQEIPTFQKMQKHTAKWSKDRNEMSIGINWTFNRKKAKIKFKLKLKKTSTTKIK